MALPSLLEIVPLDSPVRAEITVPGSKSITNRALLLAAQAEGEVVLEGALWSEDTQVMAECLQELGFMLNVRPDPNESGNRTITVYGKGGDVPRGGTVEQPLDLFVGNAGTAARFLSAFVCLGQGVYRLHGVPRMHERPQAALFRALRELGYRVDSANDRLPALIHGGGPHAGSCQVSIDESSQFASALLLSGRSAPWQIRITGENAEESPYVRMTTELLASFPPSGGFQIEADASSGSYFVAASHLAPSRPGEQSSSSAAEATSSAMPIRVRRWPSSGWQIDSRFPDVLAANPALNLGLELARGSSPEGLKSARPASLAIPSISRLRDLGDSIMSMIVLAPFALSPVRFTDLGRLRLQECERVAALRTELGRCGAQVVEDGDTLTIHPGRLHAAEIETYGDHRMAMCFAVLGLKVPGLKLKDPGCVKKTFPNFFQKLAAPAPNGLGALIRDAQSGRTLRVEELFAE